MRYIILITFVFSIVSDLNCQIAYNLINRTPVCFDPLSGLNYSFDSGARTFLLSNIKIKGIPTLFAFSTDVTGHSAITRKVKCNINIAGVAEIDKNIPIFITGDSCQKVELVLGIDLFKDKSIHYINDLRQIDFNVLMPADRRSDFIVMKMVKPILGNKYYLRLSWGGKSRKLIIDTGFNGEIFLSDKHGLTSDQVSFSDITTSTVHNFNKVVQMETIKSDVSYDSLIFRNVKIDYVPNIPVDLIGMSFFLKFKEVFFDFKNKEVWVSREILKPLDSRDIGFLVKGGHILVSFIDHNSCFYKNMGLRIGDQVKFKDQSLVDNVMSNGCGVNELFYHYLKNNDGCDLVVKSE